MTKKKNIAIKEQDGKKITGNPPLVVGRSIPLSTTVWRANPLYSPFSDKTLTAEDIIRYEINVLGNEDMSSIYDILSKTGLDLSKIPAKYLLWVCPNKKDAEVYGIPDKVVLPPKTSVLYYDGDGGYLVLLPRRQDLIQRDMIDALFKITRSSPYKKKTLRFGDIFEDAPEDYKPTFDAVIEEGDVKIFYESTSSNEIEYYARHESNIRRYYRIKNMPFSRIEREGAYSLVDSLYSMLTARMFGVKFNLEQNVYNVVSVLSNLFGLEDPEDAIEVFIDTTFMGFQNKEETKEELLRALHVNEDQSSVDILLDTDEYVVYMYTIEQGFKDIPLPTKSFLVVEPRNLIGENVLVAFISKRTIAAFKIMEEEDQETL